MARKLTAIDVVQITGYSREELRALRAAIGFHRSTTLRPRIAQEFTRQDLIVISVIRELETTYGMKRAAIAGIYKLLRTALSGPKPINPKARLLITAIPPVVTYLNEPVDVSEGTLVGLQRVFDRVDTHFGAYMDYAGGQRDLKLSPTVMRQRKSSKTG